MCMLNYKVLKNTTIQSKIKNQRHKQLADQHIKYKYKQKPKYA